MSTGVNFANEFGRRVSIHVEKSQIDFIGVIIPSIEVKIESPEGKTVLGLTRTEAEQLRRLLSIEMSS